MPNISLVRRWKYALYHLKPRTKLIYTNNVIDWFDKKFRLVDTVHTLHLYLRRASFTARQVRAEWLVAFEDFYHIPWCCPRRKFKDTVSRDLHLWFSSPKQPCLDPVCLIYNCLENGFKFIVVVKHEDNPALCPPVGCRRFFIKLEQI